MDHHSEKKLALATASRTFLPKKRKKPKVVGRLKYPEEAEKWAGKQPHLTRGEVEIRHKAKHPKTKKLIDKDREVGVPWLMFLSYMFIPLSVGMFPHLFHL